MQPQTETYLKTYKDLLERGISLLAAAGIEEAMLDAWLLLEHTANISRAWYYAHTGDEVDGETSDRYLELIAKRAQHIPLQHLTHRAWFMGYEFYVDGRALVPRQDTEILAEEALKRIDQKGNVRLLDMCTGSGCLLLSLLAELPCAVGTGTDISREALDVAAENAVRLGVADRAHFVESDLFSAQEFHKNSGEACGEYDMLISNPPYIPTKEIQSLMEEVRLHDPLEALDGGEDGLDFYRRLAKEAASYLKPDGWLLFEIGCDQGAAVMEIMRKNGYHHLEIRKDLAGLDRVVLGQNKSQEETDV